MLLLSGIFTSSNSSFQAFGISGSSSTTNDPRLSNELRKTGLSDEALLRRGGGRRIHIGSKVLDSIENAVALDIAKILDCSTLQDEMEREWAKVLDDVKLAEKTSSSKSKTYNNSGGANSYKGNSNNSDNLNNDNVLKNKWDNADDYSAELAAEISYNNNRRRLSDTTGRSDTGYDDFGLYERPLEEEYYGIRLNQSPPPPGLQLTARHLFCLIAEALTLPTIITEDTSIKIDNPTIHCDITSMEIRDELYSLWSSARSQMSEEVIQRTLRTVIEHKETLREKEVYIWYPKGDKGTEGMLRVLNSNYMGKATYNFDSEPADYNSHDNLYRFHDLPTKFVGENKLFVDVGSALGLTVMLISYLYPTTTIVSIEPASPSWLIQNINYRCNVPHNQLQYIHSILAGVGTKNHDDNDSMMKMIWRPSMTTATRSWNPEKEFDFAVDMELTVHLRTLRAILAEATPEDLPLGTPISILNLDCEGCEYNLIPSMHDATFNSIGLILGRSNWGYIPTIKKPSSSRAKETHERICKHYNFAKRCKECCDFPTLVVKHRIGGSSGGNGEAGGGGGGGEQTIAEVAGELCNDFETWAMESHLHDIPDDYGWNEISGFAAE
jgi:FkbM family methyltransferase